MSPNRLDYRVSAEILRRLRSHLGDKTDAFIPKFEQAVTHFLFCSSQGFVNSHGYIPARAIPKEYRLPAAASAWRVRHQLNAYESVIMDLRELLGDSTPAGRLAESAIREEYLSLLPDGPLRCDWNRLEPEIATLHLSSRNFIYHVHDVLNRLLE